MKNHRPIGLLAFGLFALAMTSCVYLASGRVWTTDENDLAQALNGLESLVVNSQNGSITVQGAEGAEEIAVHVVKRAGGKDDADAAACMEAIQVEKKVEGHTFHLSWKWAKPREKTWQASVSFEVRAPRQMTVAVESHNGAISVSNMTGETTLLTHNGAVRINGLAADLKAQTHNGRIDVADVVGDVDVETHNGAIVVAAVVSDVRIVTYNGGVEADLSGSEAVNGTITTHNGQVTVALRDKASARLACRTGNGAIHPDRDMSVTLKQRNRLEGQVGAGDGQLSVETHNGSITLR